MVPCLCPTSLPLRHGPRIRYPHVWQPTSNWCPPPHLGGMLDFSNPHHRHSPGNGRKGDTPRPSAPPSHSRHPATTHPSLATGHLYLGPHCLPSSLSQPTQLIARGQPPQLMSETEFRRRRDLLGLPAPSPSLTKALKYLHCLLLSTSLKHFRSLRCALTKTKLHPSLIIAPQWRERSLTFPDLPHTTLPTEPSAGLR